MKLKQTTFRYSKRKYNVRRLRKRSKKIRKKNKSKRKKQNGGTYTTPEKSHPFASGYSLMSSPEPTTPIQSEPVIIDGYSQMSSPETTTPIQSEPVIIDGYSQMSSPESSPIQEVKKPSRQPGQRPTMKISTNNYPKPIQLFESP
jgi:hypothetical protein